MFKKFFLKTWPILAIFFLVFIFFWKFFLKGLVPIPSDLIVGIYYPWRDHLWDNFVAGVPFKNGLLSDIVSIIYPWRIYGIELLKRGIWPLWIPQALAGVPLLANFQSGLFYPFNLLFLIFSNITAWSFYIILQPILAGIFCFLFFKNLKLSKLSALIGSIIFAFSGFFMVWLEYGIVGHAGLWSPLVLLTIDKILAKNSFVWLIIGVLSIGFSILAGYPQISAFLILVAFLYATYQLISRQETYEKKSVVFIFFIFILGILLSAVQLVPGWELWQLSLRSGDPTAAAFNYGLNPLKNLILLFAPDFYGNPATGNFWGWGAYNESASYVSIAGLFLAVIALFGSLKNKTLFFFKGLLVFSLLMVFTNPFSNFIYSLRLPILVSSSAGRLLFLVDFSLAVLAAFGIESIVTQKKIRRYFTLILLAVPFLMITIIVFIKPDLWPDRNLLVNLAVVRRNLILPTLILLVSLVLISVASLAKAAPLKKIFLWFLFFLIIFDLFRFGFKYTPFTSRSYLYPATQLTNFLEIQGGLYRFVGLIPQSMFIPYTLSSPEGYEPLMIKRFSEFATRINEEKFDQISTGSRWIIVNRHESPLLNLLGTKYFLSFNVDPKSQWDPQYFKYPKEKYGLVFQYGKSQVYENKKVLPRAFILHEFQVLKDNEILKTLMDEHFDASKTLLFEETPREIPEKKVGEDKVVIDQSSYFDNKVLIKTNAASGGFLFLSDNFYPGWRAFIDGQETKIYRADYTFRAVFLPKGEHTVKFIYDPQTFKIGLWLSLTSLGVLILLGTYAFLRR